MLCQNKSLVIHVVEFANNKISFSNKTNKKVKDLKKREQRERERERIGDGNELINASFGTTINLSFLSSLEDQLPLGVPLAGFGKLKQIAAKVQHLLSDLVFIPATCHSLNHNQLVRFSWL